jgi:hypothetical protein
MADKQMKVKVSRVSTVAPAIPTVKHSMFLSAIDIACLPFKNMGMLLFYKTPVVTAEKDLPTMVEKLKRSLSLVLVDFYPFAGRLDIKGGESGRPEIDCNDGGVEFFEASIDMAFEDVEINNFPQKNFFRELVQTRHGNDDASLLSIQVTAFQRGGICIGANFHHVIADGNSFWHFMKCWAECSRELPVSKNPHHMRTVFKRDNENRAIPNIYSRAEEVVTDLIKEAQIFRFVQENSLPIKYSEINASAGIDSLENTKNGIIGKSIEEETNLEISTFLFSEKIIHDLKERSGASTSFVAVAAQFWRCVMKAREVPEKEPVYFATPADCRGRVKPSLPPTYFGNCLCLCIARTTAKNLLGQDISFAAALIQEVIYSCASEVQLNNFVDFLESQLGSCNKDPLSFGNLFSSYTVMAAMSPKFPVYQIDHGWGRPLSVQSAFFNLIGGMMLFAGRGEGRSIAVSTRLPHRQMETLKQILMVIPD